jgi:glutathione peroxidase-family protein
MKILSVLVLLYTSKLLAQSSVYDINIQTLKGATIGMAEYKGKKIVVASESPNNLKNGGIDFLDSLQLTYPSVIIIAVPANDFGGEQNAEILDLLRNDESIQIIITSPDEVKKDNGSTQNPLLEWLTNDSENSHFDADVVTDRQI